MKTERKHDAGRKSGSGRFWLMIGGAGVILLAAVVFYLWTGPLGDNAVVAEVNGEPVTVREFRREILQKRGEVIAYFRTQYGAEADAGFWTQSYHGEVPTEVVKNKALQEMIKMKIQLLLFQKAGLIEDINYRSILENLKKENGRRKKAIANNQVIYGLAEFNEQTYIYYLMSTLATKLKNSLAEEWRISEAELRKYYDTVKDVYYVEADSSKPGEGKSYVPFEKAKPYLGPRYLDLKYNKYISELAQTAEILINQSVYQRIRTDR